MSSIVRHRLVNLDMRQPGNKTVFFLLTLKHQIVHLHFFPLDVSISSLTRRKQKGEEDEEETRERERRRGKEEEKKMDVARQDVVVVIYFN